MICKNNYPYILYVNFQYLLLTPEINKMIENNRLPTIIK